ncbi:MAG: DNA-directed RNA polymerase subunit beta' [Nitrospinae bacterium]|nr:DNA-directed RNA polymerase subunit beta' [Nitrospinota bacterium]
MESFDDLYERPKDPLNFNAIKIKLASPEKIKSWSSGEVTKPETINYRTFKPEKDGLFCAKIFGPTKDWECNCGKYKRIRHKGVVCEKCGVEVTQSKVRRERLGHIDLAAPVAHIWFLKSLPSRIGTFLNVSLKSLEKVIFYEAYYITDPKNTGYKEGDVITEDTYYSIIDEYGEEAIKVVIGAEGVAELLQQINPEELLVQLTEDLEKTNSIQTKKKLIKRIKIMKAFIHSGNKPEWMILNVVPVIPPDLRPLVPLEGGRFATSDLNDLYRRVINRNNRLKRLLDLKAPNIIIKNEKRMLQEAVAALFDNGKRTKVVRGSNKRPLKSLSDMLKGKGGRFRQNLLGKRVDYSGRTVIVVGPDLKLNQCGLPKKMALELFKPYIYQKLEQKGYATTIKTARKMVEEKREEVYEVLDEIIKGHPVMLNRAPTLHRLGIQGFDPILIEGKALTLHPLVCTAFNADFDGDQMAIHVPLSMETQTEVKLLMLADNNLLNPANGMPVTTPSQDIVLGCYYLTKVRGNDKGEGKVFASIKDVMRAYDNDVIGLQAKIFFRDENKEYHETTTGRVLLYDICPKSITFEEINKQMNKKALGNLIYQCILREGKQITVVFLDAMKSLGFKISTKAGISIPLNNMQIPDEKQGLIDTAKKKVLEVQNQYIDQVLTDGERKNTVIDIWQNLTESVSGKMFSVIEKQDENIMEGSIQIDGTDKILSKYDDVRFQKEKKDFNSIFIMADSGARGSETQIRQLAGMRGLMSKPSGEIIETPITANFKEGLSVHQYFISTHGARKGLADTALKTANAGYLTRRLVDVSQDVIITQYDCGTSKGIEVTPQIDSGEVRQTIGERILGRYPVDDIVDPYTNEILLEANREINYDAVSKIENSSLTMVRVRSVLTCEADKGVCALCYGRNLATGAIAAIGDAVGIIAAQSIGEPGTQLTMRTFHVGGTASKKAEQSKVSVRRGGSVRFSGIKTIVNSKGDIVVTNRNGEIYIEDDNGREKERYKLNYGSTLRVKENQAVKEDTVLADWDPYSNVILTESSGVIAYGDIVEGGTMKEEIDETSGRRTKFIIAQDDTKQPRISIKSKGKTVKRYFLPTGAHLIVDDHQEVHAGDIIAKIPTETHKTKDITGGLPRVVELFEARKPHDHAILTEIDGIVKVGEIERGSRKIIITNEDGTVKEYKIPRHKHVNVHDDDYVKAGEALVDGPANPHDILKISGENALQKYLIDETQSVYKLQGVDINDKHIEVIIRQMLRHVILDEPGDTEFLNGEQLHRKKLEKINEKLIEDGMKPATASLILLGITKSSLNTESFISAASFQETTRVLTEVSVEGKVDNLIGLKENVIMGRLIPAGTGSQIYKNVAVAENKAS